MHASAAAVLMLLCSVISTCSQCHCVIAVRDHCSPLSFCRTIYEKLGSVVSEEQRQLYVGRVEEMSPSIRYCAYNIGNLPTDVKELQKMKTNAAGSDILASKIDVRDYVCA